MGRVYQQTFIDTYAKVAFAKLYDRKTPITAADLLNNRVIPLFDSQEVKLLRVLTDRGSEYCGNPERHEYELYLAVEDIDHTRTKTKSPQTNGICDRFHRTVLIEFYRVQFRKRVYRSIEELQADLDAWLREYNEIASASGPLVPRQVACFYSAVDTCENAVTAQQSTRSRESSVGNPGARAKCRFWPRPRLYPTRLDRRHSRLRCCRYNQSLLSGRADRASTA